MDRLEENARMRNYTKEEKRRREDPNTGGSLSLLPQCPFSRTFMLCCPPCEPSSFIQTCPLSILSITPQPHAIGGLFRNGGESRNPLSSFLPLPVTHTHTPPQDMNTQENTHTFKCPTVRGWGQVCSSSSMIPKDSWDVAVVPLLCDSASVRRCLSPHRSVSFSFLCSPRPLPALPLWLSSPLLLLLLLLSSQIPCCREEEAGERSHSAAISWYRKKG